MKADLFIVQVDGTLIWKLLLLSHDHVLVIFSCHSLEVYSVPQSVKYHRCLKANRPLKLPWSLTRNNINFHDRGVNASLKVKEAKWIPCNEPQDNSKSLNWRWSDDFLVQMTEIFYLGVWQVFIGNASHSRCSYQLACTWTADDLSLNIFLCGHNN